ncbi:hypothetical protein Gorai_021655 [Gossypium raimondii]|uniref:Uncharacterized protein n=1 Tax=Gossypium raimondii TaxID=29730 RepID=A0A7J8NR45_GOSRA|nr:hypothetical protein [Gossypium raimondii]
MNISSRMVKYSVKLSDFGLDFSPHKAIKVQDLTDFIVECSFINHLEAEDGASLKEVQEIIAKSTIEELPENDTPWVLHVNGSSSKSSFRTSISLVDRDGNEWKYCISFSFIGSNNAAKYET